MTAEKIANDLIIKKIIDNNFTNYKEQRGLSFLFFCIESLLGVNEKEVLDSITEGCYNNNTDDFSIDGLNINIEKGVINLFNCQCSNREMEKEISAIKRGLKYILEKNKKDIVTIKNKNLKNKILEIRKHSNKIKKIKVNYCTNQTVEKLDENIKKYSNYFKNEFSSILKNKHNNPEFIFNIYDSKKIFFERKRNKNPLFNVEVNIRIVNGFENHSFNNEISEVKGVVLTVSGKEIARIVKNYNDKNDCLFDENIRGYQGDKNKINEGKIKEAALQKGEKFWFLNNGITIISSYVKINTLNNNIVTLEFPQIVNGQQTAKSISLASKSKNFSNKVKVICRIYETNDPVITNEITEASNTQIKIDMSDLVSNSTEQRAIEDIFLEKGYLYKRKKQNKYEKKQNKIKKSISKKDIARIGLTIFKDKPHEARLVSVNRLFNREEEQNNYYKDIFSRDPYCLLAAYIVWNECRKLSKETSYHMCFIIWKLIEDRLDENLLNQIFNDKFQIKIFVKELKIANKVLKKIPEKYKRDKKLYNSFLNSKESTDFIFQNLKTK